MSDQLSAEGGLHQAPAFTIGFRSKQILSDVAAEHKLQVSDVISSDRFDHLVAARREAILRMHAAGMPVGRIAQACNLHRTTVMFHLDPEMRAHKLKLDRARRERQAGRASA